MDMTASTMAESRRESFAADLSIVGGSNNFGAMPKSEDWQQAVDMQSVPSTTSFQDPSANAGTCFDLPSEHDFAQQADAWSLNNSVSASPHHGEAMGPNFIAAAGAVFQGMPQPHHQNAGPFSPPINQQSMAGQSQGNNSWSPSMPIAKKATPPKPTAGGQKALLAANGVRKRNARYEIPKEITLDTVDAFLAASPNEQTTAFLKASKRLLRNRQAALDSRQRKRQHTERLETEKKEFNSIVGTLEVSVQDLSAQLNQVHLEKESMEAAFNNEREEMIAKHTRETGDLRKKIDILTQHVQRLEGNQASNSSSNVDTFHHGQDGMDAMDMSYNWTSLDFMTDFSQPLPIAQAMAAAPPKEAKPAQPTQPSQAESSNTSDKSAAQGGLLFMLFLVGAFVMSSRSPPPISPASEEMRAASAALLENVLKDAGVDYASDSLSALAPRASGVNWQAAGHSNTVGDSRSGSGPSNKQPSFLDSSHIGQPTEEQMKDQAFSLSAGQYSGVHAQDFLSMPSHEAPGDGSAGRKNLATAMEEIRSASKQSGAAEVYTRTLLWDKIPNEVIRDFTKLVVDGSNSHQQQQ